MNSVYVNDFSVYKGNDDSYGFSKALEFCKQVNHFNHSSMSFFEKTYQMSGISEEAPLLKTFVHKIVDKHGITTHEDAREEVAHILCHLVDDILKKNNLVSTDIDLLVVNCSSFAPIPSVSALIVNHFKMREDIATYSLSGMGCSTSLIGMEIAQNFLKLNPDKKALVLTTESPLRSWYMGNDFRMLLANVLFKTGGVAVLMSGSRSEAKYILDGDIVRSHFGSSDTAYNSIYQTQDKQGHLGIDISFQLTNTVAPLLKKHCDRVAHKPWHKIAIHAGGLSIIQAVSSLLSLSEDQNFFSRESLRKYGNMSGASVWYTLDLIQNAGISQNEIAWLLSFGSGFKICSLFLKKV